MKMHFLKILNFLLILASLGSAFSCGDDGSSTLSLEGGTPFHPTDMLKMGPLPSLVGIFLTGDNEGATCTGVIVKQNLVLTAAHCVDSFKNNSDFQISLALSNGSVLSKIKVQRVAVHPSYIPICLGLCSDIALIEIAPNEFGTKTLRAFARPASFNYSKPSIGMPVVIAGFGCEKRPIPVVEGNCTATFSSNFWKFHPTTVVGLSHALNPASDAYFSTEGALVRVATGDSGGPVYDKDGQILGINANYVVGFQNSYHASLYKDSVSSWLKSSILELGSGSNSFEISDPGFVSPANKRCIYLETKSQPWLNSSFPKCPVQKDNPKIFNMTTNTDTYKCGTIPMSDEAILQTGSKLCRTSYSCLTAPYDSVSQTSC